MNLKLKGIIDYTQAGMHEGLMPVTDDLVLSLSDTIQRGHTALFCGAGISVNSGLPTANAFLQRLFTHISTGDTSELANLITELPFEAIVQTIAMHSDISSLIDVFMLGRPSAMHQYVAELVKRRMVTLVCTTNFDPLIECALCDAGLTQDITYGLYASDRQIDAIRWDENIPKVVKLHGTARDQQTVAITLERVAAHSLTLTRHKVLRKLFLDGPHEAVVILGYSCSDEFDLSPHIRSLSVNGKVPILIEHSVGDCFVEHIAAKPEHNPFSGYPSGLRIRIDTNKLVRTLWKHLFAIDAPGTAFGHIVPWKDQISAWWASHHNTHSILRDSILGALFLHKGSYDKAVRSYQALLGAARSLCRYSTMGLAQYSLGVLYTYVERAKDAFDAFTFSIEISRRLGDNEAVSDALTGLGNLAKSTGDLNTAERAFTEAAQAARLAQRDDCVQYAMHGLARVYEAKGNYNLALQSYLTAQLSAASRGDLLQQVVLLGTIGRVCLDMVSYNSSMQYLNKALQLAKLLGHTESIAINSYNFGRLMMETGKTDDAIPYMETAANMFRKHFGLTHGNTQKALQHLAACKGSNV